jgi:hypothetical protein
MEHTQVAEAKEAQLNISFLLGAKVCELDQVAGALVEVETLML